MMQTHVGEFLRKNLSLSTCNSSNTCVCFARFYSISDLAGNLGLGFLSMCRATAFCLTSDPGKDKLVKRRNDPFVAS